MIVVRLFVGHRLAPKHISRLQAEILREDSYLSKDGFSYQKMLRGSKSQRGCLQGVPGYKIQSKYNL